MSDSADPATEPFFMAVRDEILQTRGYRLLYRSPMCINTSSTEIFAFLSSRCILYARSPGDR